LLRRAVWWKFTDVPEVLAVSIIRAMSSDDGGSKHLLNVGKHLPDYLSQNLLKFGKKCMSKNKLFLKSFQL
jgi:hypothetical protein